jgi:hypothetical protein
MPAIILAHRSRSAQGRAHLIDLDYEARLPIVHLQHVACRTLLVVAIEPLVRASN